MNYFPEMIRKWRMILYVYFHKLKAAYFSRTSFLIFLKAEFIAESVNFSLRKHLVDFFTLPKPWFWYVYSRLLLIYFFFILLLWVSLLFRLFGAGLATIPYQPASVDSCYNILSYSTFGKFFSIFCYFFWVFFSNFPLVIQLQKNSWQH